MPTQTNYSTYTLICIFAGAIVALGAQDLHRHYMATQKNREANPSLLAELHGRLGVDAGSFSPDDIKRLKEERARHGGLTGVGSSDGEEKKQ